MVEEPVDDELSCVLVDEVTELVGVSEILPDVLSVDDKIVPVDEASVEPMELAELPPLLPVLPLLLIVEAIVEANVDVDPDVETLEAVLPVVLLLLLLKMSVITFRLSVVAFPAVLFVISKISKYNKQSD